MADAKSEELLHELFFRSAKEFPNNIAVTYSGETVESVTYRDLSAKVVDLSRYFKTFFVRNEMVGVYSRDCLNMPAVLLAIMGASAGFYPLSTKKEPQRVLEDLNCRSVRYILVENGLVQDTLNTSQTDASKTRLEVVNSDLLRSVYFTMLKLSNEKEKNVVNWSKSLAYVMQTSGTTGEPKAVFVPHSCIVPNITHLSSIFEVNCQDVVYFASPYTFDPSIVQMFLAFHNGAELLITSRSAKLIPDKFCRKLFEQHQVTIFQPTPSLLYYIGKDLITTRILSENSTLKVLAMGGESCPSLSTLRNWKHPHCRTRLYNIYGITEVSSWATCRHISDHDLSVEVDDNESNISNSCPLGLPLAQTELTVYDDNGDVVSGNGIGHLWIGGKERHCLLEGEIEVPLPMMRNSGDIVRIKDKHVWYLGRSDNQVKRFGHRINLDHIETIVCERTDVSSCTLVIEPTSIGDNKLLHLFVVPKALESSLSRDLEKYKQEVWKRIEEGLPRESRPNNVHMVQELPLTNHDKVDKRELLRFIKDRRFKHKDNRSVIESLSAMWIQCTKQNINNSAMNEETRSRTECTTECHNVHVKPSDMFMLQGGDSFQAVKLAEQIETWFRERSTCKPVDFSLLFEIVTNKTFGHLVSFVGDTIQNSDAASYDHSTELQNVRSIEKSERTLHTDLLESTGKIQQVDVDLSNIDELEPSFDKETSVKENERCTCSARRGSERFACSMCEDTPKCLLYRHDAISCSKKGLDSEKNVSWKWNVFMEKCIDATPLVVPSCLTGDGAVFIGSHSHLFTAVSLSTGNVLWRTHLGGRVESSACLSACGQLIVVGCYDGKVYVFQRRDGQINWSYQTQDVVKSSPCLDRKTGWIWVGSHDGCLYALDIYQKVCKVRVECGSGSCFSSPAISYDPHRVYIGTLHGCFLCVDPVSGKIRWLKRFEKPIFSSPLIQVSVIYVTTVNGRVKCFNHFGEEVWEFCTNDTIFSSPVGCSLQTSSFATDIIVSSHGSKVYRISSNGECRWSTVVDAPVYATPCFLICNEAPLKQEKPENSQAISDSTHECIVVVTTKGTLYVMAAIDGRILEQFSLPGEVFSSPVAIVREVVIGCRNNYLYCVKLS